MVDLVLANINRCWVSCIMYVHTYSVPPSFSTQLSAELGISSRWLAARRIGLMAVVTVVSITL